MTLAKAIQKLHPELKPFTDFLVQQDRSGLQRIVKWPKDMPLPTAEELEKAEHSTSPLDAAKAMLAAEFEKLSLGKQALWKSTREAVTDYIEKGQLAKAVETLQTTPIIYDGQEADRDHFLSLFPKS